MQNIDAIKASILNYIHHFSIYDYAAYAWLVLLFFVTVLLSIMVARRSPVFSILILLLSIVLLFAGPFVLKHYLDDFIRPTKSNIEEVKKLNFSQTLIVLGSVKNISKKNFSMCEIQISVSKQDKNNIKNFINQLKPLRKKTISIKEPIEVNATKEFRVVFDNYSYTNDINTSINSKCY